MSFFCEKDVKTTPPLQMTSIIDFLFLMLCFFACLSLSRVTIKDTDVTLAQVVSSSQQSIPYNPLHAQNKVCLSINEHNQYHWVGEWRHYPLKNIQEALEQIRQQMTEGELPNKAQDITIFLKIDKKAQWESVVALIDPLQQQGYCVRPLYQPKD